MGRTKRTDRPITKAGERSGRPERTSINGEKNRFKIEPQEEGFHYCVVNDDNVDIYLNADYHFVTHACRVGGKQMNQSAGMTDSKISFPVGNGVTGFVMRCTNEVFEDELKASHSKADYSEQQMRASLQSKADGRYGKVEIEDKVIKPTSLPD